MERIVTLEELYMISQVVAAFAVVASLVFVGLQMRQSNSTQQSLMRQTRTDRHIHMGLSMLEGSHLEMYRSLEGDPRQMSQEELEYVIRITRLGMLNSEEIVWQCKRGFLDRSVLEDQKRVIATMLGNPVHRTIWRMSKIRFDSEFIAFVDEIEKVTPLSENLEDRKQQYLQILDQVEREASGQAEA